MSTTVAAVYERGALRLLDPIPLPEASKVQVQILTSAIDDQTEMFLRHLAHIHKLLNNVEAAWESDLVRTVFVELLPPQFHTLWYLAQPPRRTLCTLLLLSVRHLQPATLTHEQIAALRFALERLAAYTFTAADIDGSREQLLNAGLPSSFAFPPEMIQSYLDER